MATKRFHSLDELIMDVKADARRAAGKAAGVFSDRVKLGTFHVTPAERLRQFLAMPAGAREQLRETLGDEGYMQYAQMQLETLAKQKDMGPSAAALLFEMLGIFGYPGQDGAAPPGGDSARNNPVAALLPPSDLTDGGGGGESDEETEPELMI